MSQSDQAVDRFDASNLVRKRLWVVALATMVSAAAHAAFKPPNAKDVCTIVDGQGRLDATRLIAKLLSDQMLDGWPIDTTGGSVTPEMRLAAILDERYCGDTSHHCDPASVSKLTQAGNELRQFLLGIRDAKYSKNFRLVRHGSAPLDRDILAAFAVDHQYDGECTLAEVAKPDQAALSTNSNAPGTIRVRAAIDDLAYPKDSPAYKGLAAATLGYEDNSVADARKYTATAAAGIVAAHWTLGNAASSGQWMELTPFITLNENRTFSTPPPKSPNTNVYGAGVLLDSLVHAFDIYQEFRFSPHITRNDEDRTQTANFNLSWVPEPSETYLDVPGTVDQLFYIMAQPSVNLGWSHVISRGTDPTLQSIDNYSRYGPGLDARVYGYSGSWLEQLSASVTYRYYGVSSGPVTSFWNLQSSLNYSPGAAGSTSNNVTLTLKYSRGKNPDTFLPVRDLVLGVGVKY